jgi:hypothetical protein
LFNFRYIQSRRLQLNDKPEEMSFSAIPKLILPSSLSIYNTLLPHTKESGFYQRNRLPHFTTGNA